MNNFHDGDIDNLIIEVLVAVDEPHEQGLAEVIRRCCRGLLSRRGVDRDAPDHDRIGQQHETAALRTIRRPDRFLITAGTGKQYAGEFDRRGTAHDGNGCVDRVAGNRAYTATEVGVFQRSLVGDDCARWCCPCRNRGQECGENQCQNRELSTICRLFTGIPDMPRGERLFPPKWSAHKAAAAWSGWTGAGFGELPVALSGGPAIHCLAQFHEYRDGRNR